MKLLNAITFLLAFILFNLLLSVQAQNIVAQDKVLIAAGQIMRPTGTNMPNANPALNPSPTSTLTTPPSSSISPGEFVSPVPIHGPQDSTQSGQPPNPVQEQTIEFDTGLAPTSNLPGFSVVQALNEALTNGPQAAAVRSQFGIARSSYLMATQQTNPTFFLDRGLLAEQVNRIGPIMTETPPWKLYFRMLSAKRLVDQTKISLLTTLWSLRNNVRKAYVELIVAQETQRNLIQLYELSSHLASVSNRRFLAGDVPQLDVLKARLASSQAEVDVNVGSKRIARAKQQLNILLGREIEAPLTVPALPDFTSNDTRTKLRSLKSDILPDFNRDVAPVGLFTEKASQSRLEIGNIGLQVQVNEANATGNYLNIVPDPSLALGKSTAGNPTDGPKITAVFFTLNQELPLTNLQQGGIFNYKAVRSQIRYQLAAQQNVIASDVANAYNNLVAARDKIRVYQDRLLRDSNEVARLARRSYEVGQSDITATLAAQQANIQTRSAYLDAVSSYASAFTDLEFSVGKPLQ
jgi:outer membrane protein, heavy metal efflux system